MVSHRLPYPGSGSVSWEHWGEQVEVGDQTAYPSDDERMAGCTNHAASLGLFHAYYPCINRQRINGVCVQRPRLSDIRMYPRLYAGVFLHPHGLFQKKQRSRLELTFEQFGVLRRYLHIGNVRPYRQFNVCLAIYFPRYLLAGLARHICILTSLAYDLHSIIHFLLSRTSCTSLVIRGCGLGYGRELDIGGTFLIAHLTTFPYHHSGIDPKCLAIFFSVSM